MNISTLTKSGALALLMAASSHAQITISMSAYQDNNMLSDGVTVVPNSTILKIGYFYNSGFTSLAAVQSAWTSSTGSMSSRLDTLDNTFYVLKAANGTALETTAGDFNANGGGFWIAVDPNGQESEAKFATTLDINPASFSPNLAGSINTIGVKPFVWVETIDRSQFALFESTKAMPTGAFPNLSLDLVMGSGGFTAIAGTLQTRSFTMVPEPTTFSLVTLGALTTFVTRRRKHNSTSTN
jgi:hypothetical protein